MSNNNFHSSWHHKIDAIATAFVFIAIGLLLILRNMGVVTYPVYHFLVSWQMLLVVIGVVQFIKHKLVPGAILVTIGVYFLFPRFPFWPGHAIVTFWPVVFIFTGVVILLTRLNRKPSHLTFGNGNSQTKNNTTNQDGFINSEVAFGSAKHIVFDPYFKGAKISNSFGSTVLDLRRTQLQDAETIIEIDCSFGGIEIYAPLSWNIVLELDTAVSAYHDKRYRGFNDLIDPDHKLIIKGDISFSGLEIKS